MKKLLNTLYVLTPESYLYHRNENICVKVGGEEKVSIPALTLENIVCFGVNTVSTPLIGFCGEKGIALTFLSGNGRFLGRVTGPHTRFWPVKCALPWKVWAWIPRLDTCMRCGQGARPLRWT